MSVQEPEGQEETTRIGTTSQLYTYTAPSSPRQTCWQIPSQGMQKCLVGIGCVVGIVLGTWRYRKSIDKGPEGGCASQRA